MSSGAQSSRENRMRNEQRGIVGVADCDVKSLFKRTCPEDLLIICRSLLRRQRTRRHQSNHIDFRPRPTKVQFHIQYQGHYPQNGQYPRPRPWSPSSPNSAPSKTITRNNNTHHHQDQQQPETNYPIPIPSPQLNPPNPHQPPTGPLAAPSPSPPNSAPSSTSNP